MKSILYLFAALLITFNVYAENPKREFRGAWLHVIGQSQWAQKTPKQQREYISKEFDLLEQAGCNAVIFQVRPTADAVYKSDLEPWSAFLTGKRGKAPSEDWDPLEYAIEEAHKRGMELHAWINPYRVTSSSKDILPANHDANKHPERFIRYDGKIFFDPAYQENIDFICKVVKDIVSRYDVDAIHMDDYFYPYPVPGKEIPDASSYNKFGKGMNKGDWRRDNVNRLIKQIHSTIKTTKPWVRFGVSPFGIWRNKKNDPKGSNTNGFENYDGLYADPLLWAREGWIDYIAPQLYWALDHKLAPSGHLAEWWNANANGVDVYIGHDTRQSMNTSDPKHNSTNEIATKVKLSRKLENIKGNIWWHGYWVTENYKGVRNILESDLQSTLALPPAYGDLSQSPAPVSGLKFENENGEIVLKWNKEHRKGAETANDVVKYVVYEFLPGENSDDLDVAETIISITPENSLAICSETEESSMKNNIYVVTAVDRMNRESKPSKIKL